MVYKNELSRVQSVLDKLDKFRNEKGEIGLTEFVSFSRRYPLLLFPAFAMQQTLRRAIIGEDYWEKMMKLRNETFGSMTMFDIFAKFEVPAAQIKAAAQPAVPENKTEPVKVRRNSEVAHRTDYKAVKTRKLSMVMLSPLRDTAENLGNLVSGPTESITVSVSHTPAPATVAAARKAVKARRNSTMGSPSPKFNSALDNEDLIRQMEL